MKAKSRKEYVPIGLDPVARLMALTEVVDVFNSMGAGQPDQPLDDAESFILWDLNENQGAALNYRGLIEACSTRRAAFEDLKQQAFKITRKGTPGRKPKKAA
jgi:hypothetical protein